MLGQQTLFDIHSATSSLESECGATRSDKQDGQTTSQCGRVPAHANLSARQAKEKGLLTSGTCGQSGFISSRSLKLKQFLGNRLQARTDSLGSTLYKLTWKLRATPTGRLISALRALAHRTPGNVFSSWPTPATRDHKGGYQGGRIRNGKISTDTLDVTAQLATWPTPQAIDGQGKACAPRLKKDSNRDPAQAGSYRSDLKDAPYLIHSQPMDFWGGAKWLYCRDGKHRPIEPGTFPLANGLANRVGRLRAYGNAINAEVAIEFISAYLQYINHAAANQAA